MQGGKANVRRGDAWMRRGGQWPTAVRPQRERALDLLRCRDAKESEKRDGILAILVEDSDGSLSAEHCSALKSAVDKIMASTDAQLFARLALLGNKG